MRYDVAIIGGGLAGLALSIDLNYRGYSVVVIEKGNYPRHKVCGEYISMESHSYLQSICPALSSLHLPKMNRFKLTSTRKNEYQTSLDLGGFGVSRYLLENLLYAQAKMNGVVFMLNSKAYDSRYNEENKDYTIQTKSGDVNARLVTNATGRKSNFETKTRPSKPNETNYVGIKYHVRIKRDDNFVEIHNFPGGYCGLSSIEEDKTCICYIVNSKKLKSVHNSIQALEKTYLYQNPHLERVFNTAEYLIKDPLAISGINFKIKTPSTDHTLFLGDSAGSIAPVTGNGMSIALRSAATLASIVDAYFSDAITKKQLVEVYSGFWNKEFSTRLKLSRHFQKLSEYPLLTNLSIGLFKPFPSLAKSIIRHTHGTPF